MIEHLGYTEIDEDILIETQVYSKDKNSSLNDTTIGVANYPINENSAKSTSQNSNEFPNIR